MATAAVNPIHEAGISVEGELGAVAERLRRSTVRVLGDDGCGSGVIWRPDVVIVTNAHVARSGIQRVELADGREFSGKVIVLDAGSTFSTRTVVAMLLLTAPAGNASEGARAFAVVEPCDPCPFGCTSATTPPTTLPFLSVTTMLSNPGAIFALGLTTDSSR